MSAAAFVPGQEILHEGRLYQVDDASSGRAITLLDAATGQRLAVSRDVLNMAASGVRSATEKGFNPLEWAKCVALAREFQPIFEAGRAMIADEVRSIAQRTEQSVRSVERKWQRFREHPRVSALLARAAGRPVGTQLLDIKVERLISLLADEEYMRRERPPVTTLWEEIRDACEVGGLPNDLAEAADAGIVLSPLPVPSLKAVRTRIRRLPPSLVTRKRFGSKAARQKHEARVMPRTAPHPLAIVQIDHTVCDYVLVSDDEERVPIGRPWLTLAIDVATRVVLGFHLSFDPPSATAVALCLEHCLSPKDPWLRGLGITAEWIAYGRPLEIETDNAKEFRGHALERGCEEIGINQSFRPLGAPHIGGHIERLNGTLMRRVHLLPGTTFSNIQQKGKDYDSAARCNMTLSEFRSWLVLQITGWYHTRVHRSLGTTPIDAWRRAFTRDGVYTPPPVVAGGEEVRRLFLPRQHRFLSRSGIALHGIQYWHEDLGELVGDGERREVHYDPRDVSRVFVRRPNGIFATAHAVNPPVGPCSLFEWRRACRLQRQSGRSAEATVREASRQAMRSAHDLTGEARRRTRKARHPAKGTGRARPVRAAVPRAGREVEETPVQFALPWGDSAPRERLPVSTWDLDSQGGEP